MYVVMRWDVDVWVYGGGPRVTSSTGRARWLWFTKKRYSRTQLLSITHEVNVWSHVAW